MARIIPFQDDNHWELQRLLPWYVTDRLDPAERAKVEAHVAGCEDCQEELRFERALAENVKAMPLDTDVGWRRMERRLKAERPRQRPGAGAQVATWGGWAVAACALIAVGVMAVPRAAQGPSQGQYHALGSPQSVSPGNLVVIFRPETAERDIRAELNAVGARIVDGPTAADAYVLMVPLTQRAGVLAKLRTQSNIVLAEPVDPGASP
jgi:anti-sigma factor RsiW